MPTITLSWTSFYAYMPAKNGYRYPPTSFSIYRKSSSQSYFRLVKANLPANALSYIDTSLISPTTYTYKILGINKYGQTKYITTSIDTRKYI